MPIKSWGLGDEKIFKERPQRTRLITLVLVFLKSKGSKELVVVEIKNFN